MSLLFVESYDHIATADMIAKWEIAGGTIGAFGRNGTQGLRDPNQSYKSLPNASGPTFVCGQAVKPRSAFPGSSLLFEVMGDNSSADSKRHCWLRINNDGTLSFVGGTTVTTTWAASLGVSYYIELKVLLSTTVGTVEVRVKDGSTTTTVLALTGMGTQNGALTAVWTGFRQTCSNVDVDDLYVCDGSGSFNNDFLGDSVVDRLILATDAASAGFNHGLTPSTGGDHGAMVDETTPNAADYNSGDTPGLKDTYAFSNLFATGAVRGIQALAYGKKADQGARTLIPVVRHAGADYEGTAEAVRAASAYTRQIFEVNPATGVAFTGGDINALELGFETGQSAASFTKLYLHNAPAPYTPATIRGSFDQTAGAVTKAADSRKEGGGINTPIAITETNATNPWRVLLGRWIGGPLAAQTISGTVNLLLGIFEDNALANLNWFLHIYVTQGDSDTPRGTLLANYSEALGVNEWPTSGAFGDFRELNAAATLSSLAVSDGDRPVFEIGYVSREASATARTGTIRYGTLNSIGDSTVPLEDGSLSGSVHLQSGFITFSNPILEGTVAVRVEQVVLEVLTGNIPVVADPSGGGAPAGGVEPTNGTSLCGGGPVYKTVRVQTDAGEKRYSYGDVPLGNTFREARVLSIAGFRRAFSDTDGRIETARTTIQLSDYDRSLRGMVASGTFLNKRVDIYAATEAQLRANASERYLASFVIRDIKLGADLKCTLQCEDYFGSILGEYGATMVLPKRLLTTTDFPNLPVQQIGKPVPIGYGLLSDEFRGANAIGVIPAIFVGARRLNDGLDWDEYVLFGHAAASWQSVFASDLRDVALWDPASLGHGPRPIKMDLSVIEGTEFLVPGYPGWNAIVGSDPFVDHNGHRYAVIYVRGQRSLDARSGECPITVNGAGVESVGDGSGTMIDEGWLQVQHFINNWWIQSYQTGNWFSIPTVNGSYSRIAALSFAAANAATATRLGGSPSVGYKGGWMLGENGKQAPIATAMAQLARDFDGEFGIDRYGRLIADVIDAGKASVRKFIDTQGDIVEGSFDANRVIAKQNNRVTIKFERNYVPDSRPDSARTGILWYSDFYGTTVDLLDATSKAAIKEERELKLEGWSLRDTATAADSGAKKLARRKDGPIYTQFRTNLCGDDVDLGDNFKVTSQEGMDSTGWTGKLHRCEAITYYLDEDMVELEGQAIA